MATTIGQGLVDTQFVNMTTILSAILGAIAWNLLTWWLALPSSSSHALVGGLCGATLSSAFQVPLWVKIICALTMAAGTAAGGWRIIRTLGHKVVRLQPVHGFAAETSAAAVIQIATHWGIPVSTTHIISTSIMGVGATKRLSAVKWGLVERMLWAWVLTLPVTACLGFLLDTLLRRLG